MKYFSLICLCSFLLCACHSFPTKDLNPIAEKIEHTLNEGNPDYLNDLMSHKSMVRKAVNEFVPDRQAQKMLEKKMKEAFKIGDIILNMRGDDGKVEVIKIFDNKIVLSVYDNEMISYVELIFYILSEQILLSDIYFYASGCKMSDDILTFAYASSKLKMHEVRKVTEDIVKIRTFISTGEIDLAKQTYDNIPKVMKNVKTFKSMEFAIGTRDPNIDVESLINHHISKNPENEKFLAYLKFLNAYYQPDCFLMEQSIEDLSNHTGVDTTMNIFVRECDASEDKI